MEEVILTRYKEEEEEGKQEQRRKAGEFCRLQKALVLADLGKIEKRRAARTFHGAESEDHVSDSIIDRLAVHTHARRGEVRAVQEDRK